jgi:pimeloyl-ACP methyl ester carboxylesterase
MALVLLILLPACMIPPSTPGAGPPLVFVHGFQGLSGSTGQGCKSIPAVYPSAGYPMGDLPGWFAAQGYAVWLAYYETRPTGTPSLAENAGCLRTQLAYIARRSGGQPLTIIAHSMGGPVSRAALYDPAGDRFDVSTLITLGSPHAGLPIDFLAKFPRFLCQIQRGACELAFEAVPHFNAAYPNLPDTAYWFLGGVHGSSLTDWWLTPRAGANDGFVGAYSAVGLTYPAGEEDPPGWRGDPAGQIWTDETHGPVFGADFAYYLPRLDAPEPGAPSHAFTCIFAVLTGVPLPGECPASAPAPAVLAAAQPLQYTFVQQLEISPLTQTEAAAVQVDSTAAESGWIVVFWDGGRPEISLSTPGQDVLQPGSPDFESSGGNGEVPPLAVFSFSGRGPGVWTLNVSSETETSVAVFAVVESDRVLTVGTDRAVYTASDQAIEITANLTIAGEPLPGGTVFAYLEKDLEAAVELTFNGTSYTGFLPVPTEPGPYLLTVAAAAQNGSTFFNRQVDRVIIVQ